MKYCNAGVFWDLTDLIAKQRSVFLKRKSFPTPRSRPQRINGKNYMFPLIRCAARVSVIYRQDWAEKVGAEPRQP
jgi:ABC-type glycerol-3-phosphate transport system substrate-binding protein